MSLSKIQLDEIQLEQQRERLDQEYRHKLQMIQAIRGKNAHLIYENQVEAANEIVRHFLNGIVWVLLVAQPGAGKTGVMMEVLRMLGQHIGEHQIHTDNMLVCTGMSDKDWENTMRNGMLRSLHDTVYHRGRIGKKDVRKMENGIIVTDECHVAAEAEMTIARTLKEAGLLNIPTLEAKRMKMLDVSATPEGVLADLSRWESKTEVVVLRPSEKYKGFQTMIDDERLLEAGDFDLSKEEDVYNLLGSFDARYVGKTKKYFPIRVPEKSKKAMSDARTNIKNACEVFGWADPWKHDSVDTVEDIDEKMKTAPPKHTVILIKGFWRASKRFIRTHVGGSYEAKSSTRDDTTTAQGLTARFCDTFDWEGDQKDNDLRPIHYADVKAIEEYLQWCSRGYDYKQAAYRSKRIYANGKGKVENPVTKVHISQVIGILAKKEISTDPATVPEVIQLTKPEYESIKRKGKGNEWDYSTIEPLLKKYNSELALKLTSLKRNRIIEPEEEKSYNKYITGCVAAHANNTRLVCMKMSNDSFQVYLDKKEHRMIVSIYYGSKVPQ